MCMVSSGMFAYIINEISMLISDINKSYEEYNVRLTEMNSFMQERNVN